MVPNNKMQKRFWIFTLVADCIDAPLSASKFMWIVCGYSSSLGKGGVTDGSSLLGKLEVTLYKLHIVGPSYSNSTLKSQCFIFVMFILWC
jgi:hypothetical protein